MEITVDSRAVSEALRSAPIKFRTAMTAWVRTWSFASEREAKVYLGTHVSAGATGQTASSIHTIEEDGGLMATVKPTVKYAYWVHQGRGPGKMPPWGEGTSLNSWARRMDMNPFLVARAIGRHGTKGIKFMDEAYKVVEPLASSDADRVISNTVGAL